jgi:hypothetical protein
VIKRHHNHEQAAQKVDRIQPGSAGCLYLLRPGFSQEFAAWFFFKNCLLRQPSGSPQRFQPKGHDMFILREVAGRVVMQRAPDCRDYWRLSAASTYGISAP